MLEGQIRNDARFEQKLDSRALASKGDRAPATREGLDISLVSTLAYDSNIFIEAEDETGSLVAQVEPTIGWTGGERDKTWVRLAYEGAAVVYFSETEESRFDNRVRVEGGVRGKQLALAYSARWARVGSPTPDVGGQITRQEWGGEASVSYNPKGKLSYRVFGERSAVELDDPDLIDLFQVSGGIAAEYDYSSKTQLELSYRLGQVDIDQSGTQNFHRVLLQGLWTPREKIRVSVQAGAEYRDYEVGSELDPYFVARVDWTPRAKTGLYLEAYRREESSAALEGESFELTGLRAGVTQRFRDGWSGAFELGGEHSDYFGITGLPESGREDNLFFVRPSVTYSLAEDSEIAFVYQWTRSSSNEAEFGFTNHQLGVSLNHRF